MVTKEEFERKIGEMLRKDAHWPGAGHITVADNELKTFLEHLWAYFLDEGPNYDEKGLARALIATDGKYQSSQDRAAAIVKKLGLLQQK